MLSQGKELAAIDFESIIGGPLQAVIKAQASSAQVTTEYIQQTAFEPSSSGSSGSQQIKFIDFDFSQMMGGGGSHTGAEGAKDALTIKVPLLTMLPIPFIRVDSMTIDFNVTLHATNTVNETNTASSSASGSGSENMEIEKTQWKTSISDKNTYQNNTIIDDTYSMNVTVHAVQDQMPGGMQNVLDIFSNIIQSQSALVQQVMSEQVAAQSKQLQSDMASNPSGASGGGS